MTSKCLLCQSTIIHELRPQEILAGKKLMPEYLCQRCRAEFQLIGKPCCPTCGRSGSIKQCQDCQMWQQQGYSNFQHRALFKYNTAMHDYFKRYKRYGDYHLRLVFQPYLLRALRHFSPPFIYVPSDFQHWQNRQFDPVWGLFSEIVKLTPALIKLPTTKAQAQKSRQERMQAPQFLQFNPQYTSVLQAQQITILDDIYTTGRTIFHVHDCLRQQSYTGKLVSLSLAR